jgi:hypothetical protein
MTTRIVLLGRLRDGVDRTAYEQWVVERDYPFARALPAIASYHVSRIEGFLFGSEGKLDPKWDYVEVIDVPDLEAYQAGVGTEEGTRFLEEWPRYVDDFVAVQGQIVG